MEGISKILFVIGMFMSVMINIRWWSGVFDSDIIVWVILVYICCKLLVGMLLLRYLVVIIGNIVIVIISDIYIVMVMVRVRLVNNCFLIFFKNMMGIKMVMVVVVDVMRVLKIFFVFWWV